MSGTTSPDAFQFNVTIPLAASRKLSAEEMALIAGAFDKVAFQISFIDEVGSVPARVVNLQIKPK